MIEKRRKLITPIMTRDCVLARMVEKGEIKPWLPMSAEDVEFLDSRVKEILGLPPEQKPRYLDDYVFQTGRPKSSAP